MEEAIGLEKTDYYNKYDVNVKIVSKEVINTVIIWGNHYIDDFIEYIKDNKIERLRSKEEYSLEFLYIGILLLEYLDNARAFKNIPSFPLKFLFNRNSENRDDKGKISSMLEQFANKIVHSNKDHSDEYTFNDFKKLIKWLDATSQFEEELLRFKNWKSFLKSENEQYANHIIERAIEMALYLNEIGNKNFKKYVEIFQTGNTYKNIDGKLVCLKSNIQYYFSIIFEQVISQIYQKRCTDCKDKIILIPSYLRRLKNQCCSIKTNNGYKCKKCAKECNVNRLNKLVDGKEYRVYSIDSEKDLVEQVEVDISQTNAICIINSINMINLGYRSIRLGYIPKLVNLDRYSFFNGVLRDNICWQDINF